MCFFDPNINTSMSAQVTIVNKSANYYLRNIGKIRKVLNTDTTKGAIVLLVIARVDYCNGLLCGIFDELLCRPQKVQNNAARVVVDFKKYKHITPIVKDLHWLPIRKRIDFRILLCDFQMHSYASLYLGYPYLRAYQTSKLCVEITPSWQFQQSRLEAAKQVGLAMRCGWSAIFWWPSELYRDLPSCVHVVLWVSSRNESVCIYLQGFKHKQPVHILTSPKSQLGEHIRIESLYEKKHN